ncbi:CPBP family intramembrane glutamic endopeptidase [Leucobacter sp. USHLN153]|uniref:CPBP family intramembrane glutamic endopeptidase n=1 Tax=Leucobacter sp. USHLN153 TaxID=3081268 RepID=UPI0030187830
MDSDQQFPVSEDSSRADGFARVPWGAVALFVVVSFGLAWVVALPVWVQDSAAPGYAALFQAVASAMMFTPAIAVLAVLFITRTPRRERLRLLGIWPLRPARRVVWAIVVSVFAPLGITVATIAVAVLFGWTRLDLVEFSGFQAVLDGQLASLDESTAEIARQSMPPIGLLVALQLAVVPFAAIFNGIFAFGEEVGWRGWLLPALRPLGTWPALAISGAIWGLWHSPVILLGYNFGLTDWRGVALMTVGCIFWGALLGWARLRTGSLWPAVFGHGALNASAGLASVLVAVGAPLDPALVLPLGVAGWIVLGAILVALVLSGQFRADRQPELAPKRIRQPRAEQLPATSRP